VFKLGIENYLGIPYRYYCFEVQRSKVNVRVGVGVRVYTNVCSITKNE